MILAVSMVPTFSCPVLDDILCSTCELCFCICVRAYLVHSDISGSRTQLWCARTIRPKFAYCACSLSYGENRWAKIRVSCLWNITRYDTRCILMFCINETCVIHTSYRALMKKKQLDLMGAYLRRTNTPINPSLSIVPHQ